jgi:hypothetical protein
MERNIIYVTVYGQLCIPPIRHLLYKNFGVSFS